MIKTSNPRFWEAALARDLLERTGPAPRELIDYITIVNVVTGFDFLPQAVNAPPDFLQDVREAIDDMPQVVKHLLDAPCLGVYMATGLGSSAVTDIVAGADGRVIGVVTALDLDAFSLRSANEWATSKENTAFREPGPFSIEAHIEEQAHDNRKNAIQFLLLHEFGHVLTAGRSFLPPWWIDPQQISASEDYSFLPFSWQVTPDKRIVPLASEDFPLRTKIAYYTQGDLSGEDLFQVYQALQATGFASAYAATNAYDDFAESFASYVHTILMKKPMQTRICLDGRVILEQASCWTKRHCAQKRALLASFLGEGQLSY